MDEKINREILRREAAKELSGAIAAPVRGWLETALIVFVILRLVGVTDWAWWWVLSPLWGAVIIGVAIHMVCRFLIVKI